MSSHRPTFTLLATAVVACALCAVAQPKAEIRLPEQMDRATAAARGQQLVADLLSQKPEANSSASGTLRIRDQKGNTTIVQVEFTVEITPTNVISRYAASSTAPAFSETVLVFQSEGRPNEYFLATGEGETPRRLPREEVMRPFARSDFWISDLGLDFLRWPLQLVTGTDMRRGQSCEVLESSLPDAPNGGYSKVVSWIASQKPGVMLVHADAYDAKGAILKQFDPKKLQRVEGQWQLRSMEIRNRQTGSRSVIEFNLE